MIEERIIKAEILTGDTPQDEIEKLKIKNKELEEELKENKEKFSKELSQTVVMLTQMMASSGSTTNTPQMPPMPPLEK